MMTEKETRNLITDVENIGIITSPSSTNLIEVDVLNSAIGRKLIGELICFPFHQNGDDHYAIGQITEVSMRNVTLEDPAVKYMIREQGHLDSASHTKDTYMAKLSISAVFGERDGAYYPSLLGTVPPSGTGISPVNDQVLDRLLGNYRSEIFYLGHVYGSEPRLPLWFKHFGKGANGSGEAYHIGLFGKTGSGKSVLAKMAVLAYTRHPEMSVYIIDPQGEFALDITGGMKDSGYDLRLSEILKRQDKEVIVKSVSEIILQGWPLFTDILRESNFFQKIGLKNLDDRIIAAEDITRALKGKFKTFELVSKDAFFQAFKIMGGETANRKFQAIFKEFSYNKDKFNDLYETSWRPVCELFRNREGGTTMAGLITRTITPRNEKKPVVVLDLSSRSAKNVFWNETIKSLAIGSFLDLLKEAAEQTFKKNRFLNSLVILDEAHRLAPREETEHEAHENVRLSLIDAVRTTRKYGLGWLFISQTLASLPREIVEQMRIMFFGFGLAFGREMTAIQELIGDDDNALRLYRSFRDPHSAFDVQTKQYPFMTIGPVSPLSFSGTPLYFNAYNTAEEFLAANQLIEGRLKTPAGTAGTKARIAPIIREDLTLN